MSIYKIFLVLVFTLVAGVKAQSSGWSDPVPIDSTSQFFWPLIAVSPQGQIATVGFGGSLYVSDDNGKSFQLRYQFTPPVPYYHIFSPNGLAYDSNSVLWVYWAWNQCDGPECIFYIQRKLYLSRSTDGGNTFEHVLQFDAGFSMQIWGPANPVLLIEEDNTIHFLRDSAWYN
jgi:hypothetical protein